MTRRAGGVHASAVLAALLVFLFGVWYIRALRERPARFPPPRQEGGLRFQPAPALPEGATPLKQKPSR